MKLVVLLQAAGLGLGSSIGQAQQGAHNGSSDGIGNAGEQALGKQLLHGLLIDDDVQHGSHNAPAENVADDLADVEGQDGLLADLMMQLAGGTGNTHHQAVNGRSDDPAPPHAPAKAEVDEGMTDQTHQGAGQGAIDVQGSY